MEASAERAGWGAPPTFHILHRLTGTPNIAVTVGSPAPRGYAAIDVLAALARSVHRAAGPVDPATLAYILVVEREVAYKLVGEVQDLGDAAPLHSNTARSLFLSTLAGRDIHLMRYRGEQPEVQHECATHPPDPLLLLLRVCANAAALTLDPAAAAAATRP